MYKTIPTREVLKEDSVCRFEGFRNHGFNVYVNPDGFYHVTFLNLTAIDHKFVSLDDAVREGRRHVRVIKHAALARAVEEFLAK